MQIENANCKMQNEDFDWKDMTASNRRSFLILHFSICILHSSYGFGGGQENKLEPAT